MAGVFSAEPSVVVFDAKNSEIFTKTAIKFAVYVILSYLCSTKWVSYYDSRVSC